VTACLLTVAVSFVSAVLPIVNLEAYLGGLAALGHATLWTTLGVSGAAAAGQMAGKTLFYLAGRGAVRLPNRLHRHAQADHRSAGPEQRTRAAAEDGHNARWRAWLEGTPVTALGLVATSASVGLPPFAIVSALAGVVRVPLASFVVAGLLGRWLRFAVVLGLIGTLAT
jgi:membrane protein YqaA with SNARE-associated domain